MELSSEWFSVSSEQLLLRKLHCMTLLKKLSSANVTENPNNPRLGLDNFSHLYISLASCESRSSENTVVEFILYIRNYR